MRRGLRLPSARPDRGQAQDGGGGAPPSGGAGAATEDARASAARCEWPHRTPPCWRRPRRSPRPGSGCGLVAGGRFTPRPGERGSISGYLEEPAGPLSLLTFEGWPARAAAGAPAGCSCSGAGSPAALRAADKAGPRRKEISSGFTLHPRRDQPRTEPTCLPKNGILGTP